MLNSSNPEEVNRLSELPEPLLLQIISLLPFKFSVRTSILARRFRHLWKATSSVVLDRKEFPSGYLFNSVTSRCLRLRDPSAPLRSFSLKAWFRPFPINFLKKWLDRANLLGMQHLTLHVHTVSMETIFPFVIGIQSLQTLVINDVCLGILFYPGHYTFPPLIPPSFSQTQLKYLHITAKISPSELRLLILGLRNLESLWVEPYRECDVDLSSPSVKILKLTSHVLLCAHPKISLSFPSLEFLDLSIKINKELKQFHVNMPILKSAVITIQYLAEENVPVLCDILRALSNVSELTLHLGTPSPKALVGPARKQRQNEDDLFHPLVEPGKDMILFPNLRSLRLSMCFYENALQDLICLLRHSPVIDSLHLIHVDRPSYRKEKCWAPEVWHSKLPRNPEGNRKYADFTNLKTGDKKSEAIELLSGENPSKRLKMWLPKPTA